MIKKCSIRSKKLCLDPECEFCPNRAFSKFIPMVESTLHLIYTGYNTDKQPMDPRLISKGIKNIQLLFDCFYCCHKNIPKYSCDLTYIKRTGCPYCAGQILCESLSCTFCQNRVFDIKDKPYTWSSKNKIRITQVSKGSSLYCLFDCQLCFHEFTQQPYRITRQINGCIYCAHQKLCPDILCTFCHNNSFIVSEKSRLWSAKNTVKPRDVLKSSGAYYLFDCDICFHEYSQTLACATAGNSCGYCSSDRFCEDDCDICAKKSFLINDFAKYWDYNKNVEDITSTINPDKTGIYFKVINPRNKMRSCRYIGYFICKKGHHFSATLNDMSEKGGCPCCYRKTEAKVYEFLTTIYPDIIKDHAIKGYPNIKKRRFDFVIKNTIIELDGGQHFIGHKKSNYIKISQEEQITIDCYKMYEVADKYVIIRIVQVDVLDDNYDWQTFLTETLNKQFVNGSMIVADYNKHYYNDHYNLFNDLMKC